jgi:penicillin amidase
MRMVIDLGDLSASTMINSTGQSGHAFHRHYDDMLQQWARGEQNPMRWTREQVTSDAAAVLNLEPAA